MLPAPPVRHGSRDTSAVPASYDYTIGNVEEDSKRDQHRWRVRSEFNEFNNHEQKQFTFRSTEFNLKSIFFIELLSNKIRKLQRQSTLALIQRNPSPQISRKVRSRYVMLHRSSMQQRSISPPSSSQDTDYTLETLTRTRTMTIHGQYGMWRQGH